MVVIQCVNQTTHASCTQPSSRSAQQYFTTSPGIIPLYDVGAVYEYGALTKEVSQAVSPRLRDVSAQVEGIQGAELPAVQGGCPALKPAQQRQLDILSSFVWHCSQLECNVNSQTTL